MLYKSLNNYTGQLGSFYGDPSPQGEARKAQRKQHQQKKLKAMDKPPFLGLADQSVHSEDGVVVTPWGRPVMEIIFSPPPPWAQCMTMAISVACRGFCHDYLEGVQVQSNFRGGTLLRC